jgi:hypothetical protein
VAKPRRHVGDWKLDERSGQGPGHERSYTPGRGAWVLRGRFYARILIAHISSGLTTTRQALCLSSPGVSVCTGFCGVFEPVLGEGQR